MSLPSHNIDPVAFEIPILGLPIRWYSLGYIGGLALGWWYVTRLLTNARLWAKGQNPPFSRAQLDDIVFWVAIGVILGGRLGYLFFYEPSILLRPWEAVGAGMDPGLIKTAIGWIHFPPALKLWNGGMSFHGGLIGVTLAGILYTRKHGLNPLSTGDLFACAAPIGIFLVRIANFINGELYGRPWDGPWAMQFPAVNEFGQRIMTEPRHPSQLYEAALEGLVLFFVIRIATHMFGFLKRPGATIGLFLSGYALSRIFVENFREPDAHMPDFPLGVTMGMILSTPMLLFGLWLIWRTRADAPKAATKPAS